MLEITILSLFVGSLGAQATLLGNWLRWQQVVVGLQSEEEEEILTRYETKEDIAKTGHGNTTAPRQTANGQTANGQTANGAAKEAQRDPRLMGWEFKIVRANRDLFRDPAVFQRMCQEESESGWIMLEKLDDRRVRFKRPIAMRDIVKAEFLNYDPYRCHYGPTHNSVTWLGAIAALTAILLPAYLGYALVSMRFTKTPVKPAATAVPGIQALPSDLLSQP
ncbi:hypothetical protein H6F90_28440 [Trichocoleus sp. FACHB-591]|uniref:hypothetical protein n=1 Tax=unclassified Trichocoleus TaxID=2628910 RepID=UPI001682DE5E|nr:MULTISPECIES: hypothetical protein [unclassified Trichocoleus]MBD2098996.1 hypothetical protein [Trichocoleus sp. FACHB-591]MBD2123770.1 hypothetical protein [Trichocoleus sp. FACHB-262]